MSVRRTTLLLVAWLIPAVAHAGHHKFGVYVAPSYLNAKGSSLKLSGWHVSGEATLGEDLRWLSLTADVSAHFIEHGSETPEGTTQITVMLGPRFTVLKDHPLEDFYAHILLLGAVHRTEEELGVSDTAGALAVGTGYDISLNDKWGVRAQVDYLLPVSSDVGHGWRFSVGAVFRFVDPSHH